MGDFPIVIRIFILFFLLTGLPMLVGNCLVGATDSRVEGGFGKTIFLWISGQMTLWAVFQVLCVPMVLHYEEFQVVVVSYGILLAVFALVGAAVYLLRRKQGKTSKMRLRSLKEVGAGKSCDAMGRIVWAAVVFLLVLQLVLAVCLTYADGDDAYYVTVSTLTENSGIMYRKLPYTGGATDVDIRHGLAPFPIWIAFLARVSGIPAVSVAHVAMPLMLIPMSYGIFYLLGTRLFTGKKRGLALFLLFAEILVIFGDYSFYTVENFMLARSRQGKSVLGSVVLPFLFYLLMVLLDNLQEQKKCSVPFWGLLLFVVLTGCLCSTMGTALVCLLMGVTGLCAAFAYRRWKFLLPMLVCCMPCAGYAIIYALS